MSDYPYGTCIYEKRNIYTNKAALQNTDTYSKNGGKGAKQQLLVIQNTLYIHESLHPFHLVSQSPFPSSLGF
jgi:hypothetical protein